METQKARAGRDSHEEEGQAWRALASDVELVQSPGD